METGAFSGLLLRGPGDCAAGLDQYAGSAVLVGPVRTYVSGTFRSQPTECGELDAGPHEVSWSMDGGVFIGVVHIHAE
jgi:hypothetical protein